MLGGAAAGVDDVLVVIDGAGRERCRRKDR